MATTTKTGYCNGSDMLLYIGGKAVGHCTTHTTTINSETKERAVKPVAIEGISAGRWKNKGVVGLSVSISAEGLVFYQTVRDRLQVVSFHDKQGAERRGQVHGA